MKTEVSFFAGSKHEIEIKFEQNHPNNLHLIISQGKHSFANLDVAFYNFRPFELLNYFEQAVKEHRERQSRKELKDADGS